MKNEEYINKIIMFFKDKEEILGSELKAYLGMENSGSKWGSLLSSFIASKLLIKLSDKYEKVNSKPVYYYKLGALPSLRLTKEENYNMFIMDQLGHIYPYPVDKTLDDYLKELLTKNCSLELSVCKKIKTVKGELNLIVNNLGD